MKISVLGCGRWGSFIGWYLATQKHNVIQWGLADSYSYQILEQTGRNEYVPLHKDIKLEKDLKVAVDSSDVLIISISSQSLRQFMQDVSKHNIKNKTFILCMKGVEEATGKRLTEVMIESGVDKNNVCVWVGPGHIQDLTNGKPNCMIIDGYNGELVKFLADNLKSDLIRFYYGQDIIGTEIGAASKNVMGITAGMLDGLNFSTLKGPLMARGAREVARLIKAMGGNELSAYGLCHLGDYETTLFSEFSNNRKFGEDFVKNVKFEKLAEGVTTAKAMKKLGEIYNEELPITNAIYGILYEGKDVQQSLNDMFSRSSKAEFL